jgi:hypothetical protein
MDETMKSFCSSSICGADLFARFVSSLLCCRAPLKTQDSAHQIGSNGSSGDDLSLFTWFKQKKVFFCEEKKKVKWIDEMINISAELQDMICLGCFTQAQNASRERQGHMAVWYTDSRASYLARLVR